MKIEIQKCVLNGAQMVWCVRPPSVSMSDVRAKCSVLCRQWHKLLSALFTQVHWSRN